MAFGFHWPFETVVPNLATSIIILPVPLEGRTTIEFPNSLSQFPHAISLHQRVVVVWQYAPSVDTGAEVLANPENL